MKETRQYNSMHSKMEVKYCGYFYHQVSRVIVTREMFQVPLLGMELNVTGHCTDQSEEFVGSGIM
jgi:hypothetical protein